MALVIPDNHYQLLFPFQHSGLLRSAAITFGVRLEPGVENPENVADDMLVAFSAAFGAQIDSQVTVGPVIATFDQDGVRGSISGTASFVGGADGRESSPPNTAVLVQKNTGRVGRPGRGRFFLPWTISRDAISETGTLLTLDRNSLQTMADNLLVQIDTQREGAVMVILHEEGVPGGTTPSVVNGLTVDGRIGTQRRRNR